MWVTSCILQSLLLLYSSEEQAYRKLDLNQHQTAPTSKTILKQSLETPIALPVKPNYAHKYQKTPKALLIYGENVILSNKANRLLGQLEQKKISLNLANSMVMMVWQQPSGIHTLINVLY